MRKLLAKLWPGKSKEPEISAEEKRQAGDAAKLAEYRDFDAAVGASPTAETLRKRFQESIFAGYTRAVADTLEKGAEVPNEIVHYWHPPFGGNPLTMKDKPLEVAARNAWADMVGVLLKASDDDNLRAALHAAETNKNIGIARAIHDEMTRRASPESAPAAEEPMALQSPVKISKPLSLA